MSTHVIILAQGSQRRLPELAIPKQLLPLEAYTAPQGEPGDAPERLAANRTLIYRTMRQVSAIMGPFSGLTYERSLNDKIGPEKWRMEVVAERKLAQTLHRQATQYRYLSMGERTISFECYPEIVALADPGNSSLKGINRYLDTAPRALHADRTVVLLGDVLYSWDVLVFLLRSDDTGPRFSISHDLTEGGGELWGLSWSRKNDRLMIKTLDEALAKHPPFTEYQPGQMRQWYFRIPENLAMVQYTGAGDYTMDVDTPKDIPLLANRSYAALADDRKHGIAW